MRSSTLLASLAALLLLVPGLALAQGEADPTAGDEQADPDAPAQAGAEDALVRGVGLLAAGDAAAALSAFEEAASLQPDLRRAYYYRARALAVLARLDEAAESLAAYEHFDLPEAEAEEARALRASMEAAGGPGATTEAEAGDEQDADAETPEGGDAPVEEGGDEAGSEPEAPEPDAEVTEATPDPGGEPTDDSPEPREASPTPFGPPSWPKVPATAEDGGPSSARTARAKYTDFVRSTITFYVGDDNVLAGPVDGSPGFGQSNEYPELFFDGLNAEKTAVVSETHMTLYGKMPGFLPFVDTEAALVLEFEVAADPDNGQLSSRFRDDGSYVAATFWFSRSKKGKNIKFVAWPYNADRFRLGYLYDLTWGGNRIYFRNEGPAPGFKLNVDLERVFAYVGAKSMNRVQSDTKRTESYWGVLAGLGPNVWFGPGQKMQLRYDVEGGYFERGTFVSHPFQSTPVIAFGISQRVLLAYNNPQMGVSPDQRLITNDAERQRETSMVPLRYYGPFAFGVSAEFSTLWQSLQDSEDLDALVFQNALAGAVQAQVRVFTNLRVGIDAVYRDLSYIRFNTPSRPQFVALSPQQDFTPQVYGALWADYHIKVLRLTPGVVVGLMQPASVQAEIDAAGNRQTTVVLDAVNEVTLPIGQDPFTVLSVKGRLTWALSHILSVVGEVSFNQDWNVSKSVDQEGDAPALRVLDTANAQQLGLNLLVQARF